MARAFILKCAFHSVGRTSGIAPFSKVIDDVTALNDADTADLFTEISRGVDKSLWMVEAHVQETPAEEKQGGRPPDSHEASRR